MNVTEQTDLARLPRAPLHVGRPAIGLVLRYLGAAALTAMLIGFLVMTRWLDSRTLTPDTTIRTLSGIDAVDSAPPPPPPPSEPPPPPPKTPPLPKLDIVINSPAPPIRATVDPQMDPTMTMADFTPAQPQERKRMIFSLAQLDGQPRLVNRPSVSFPASQRARGVREGRVTLEVEIGPAGRAEILRVIDTSHPDFTKMARTFATRARFTSPKKDGRPVTARFQWPLVLR